MNALLQNLLKLQSLEFDQTTSKATIKEAAELRAGIPEPILEHYDRLRARGKKGIAIVRNQVCAGCHMRLPLGVIMTLMQARDIQLCDSCGRYLYLPAASETPAEPEAKPKAARKRRKAKAALNPA